MPTPRAAVRCLVRPWPANPAQTLIVRVFQWLLGFNVIEPKVQDRPKIVLDLEEPEIEIGPRKLFSY